MKSEVQIQFVGRNQRKAHLGRLMNICLLSPRTVCLPKAVYFFKAFHDHFRLLYLACLLFFKNSDCIKGAALRQTSLHFNISMFFCAFLLPKNHHHHHRGSSLKMNWMNTVHNDVPLFVDWIYFWKCWISCLLSYSCYDHIYVYWTCWINHSAEVIGRPLWLLDLQMLNQ